MRHSPLTSSRGLLISAALLSLGVLAAPTRAQKDQDAFFGLEKIWDVHVVIEKEVWKGLFPGKSNRWTRMFGKYPYGRADVTIGAHTIKNVGFRMKGNATFAATAGTMKRSFKLDFNRYDPKGRFLGLKKLNMQCNAVDQTQIKEAVSYRAYHDSGVAASRTAFARLYVTMPGVLDRAYVGLYTLVEQVDQGFAKRTYGPGMIVKPDRETLGYRGPEWTEEYTDMYHPKSGQTPELSKVLIACAAAYDEVDDEVFVRKLEATMDVDQFLRYIAVTTIINSADCPFNVPDNYYLMVVEKTKKVVWIPWDFNWSLGGWSRMGRLPVDDLSIMRPSQKVVFTRVLSIPRYERRYREIVLELINGPCSAKTLTASIRKAQAVVAQALADEAKRPAAVTDASEELGGKRVRQAWLSRLNDVDVEGLIEFVVNREASVKDQLAGRSEGRPAGRAWGQRRGPRGSGTRTVLAGTGALDPNAEPFAKDDIVRRLDAGYAALDGDSSGDVTAEELAAAARRRLAKVRHAHPEDRERSAGWISRRSLRALDANADSVVSRDEWRAGIQSMLEHWDRDRNGAWSRRELDLVPLSDGR